MTVVACKLKFGRLPQQQGGRTRSGEGLGLLFSTSTTKYSANTDLTGKMEENMRCFFFKKKYCHYMSGCTIAVILYFHGLF